MKELQTCCLCGGKNFTFLFRNHDRLHGIRGEFSLWECVCGLAFLNPQPDEKEVIQFYPQDYTAYNDGNDRGLEDSFKDKLQNFYYNSKDSSVLKKLISGLFPFVLQDFVIKPGGRLLNYECGSGNFSKNISDFKMEVYGIDFNKTAVASVCAKGFKVYHSLEDAHFPDEFFDVITLNQVKE